MLQSFDGFVLTLIAQNELFYYRAKSETRELQGLRSECKERALFNIQFDVLCEKINNLREPAFVLSPFTNPSQKYLNLPAKKVFGDGFDFPKAQKPRLYIDGEIELFEGDKTIKVCNQMYDTDPQLIVTKVIKIYDSNALINSPKLAIR